MHHERQRCHHFILYDCRRFLFGKTTGFKGSLRGVHMKITNLLPGTWRVGNDTMIAGI